MSTGLRARDINGNELNENDELLKQRGEEFVGDLKTGIGAIGGLIGAAAGKAKEGWEGIEQGVNDTVDGVKKAATDIAEEVGKNVEASKERGQEAAEKAEDMLWEGPDA